MGKRILQIFVMFVFAINCFSQNEARVKSFTLTTDHISSSDRRKDFNGRPCALVKVQVVDEIQRVEGNKIGKIEQRGVEKWIYMCKGSRNMKLHLKNHLPVKVVFQDYKINGLESNRVYELVIEFPSAEKQVKEMQTLVINYTPRDAIVVIDSKTMKGDGRIETKLPVGEHRYSISAFGYATVESEVKLNNVAPRIITETLVAENATSVPKTVSQTPVGTSNLIPTGTTIKIGENGALLTLKVSPFYAKIKIDGQGHEASQEGELSVPVAYGNHNIVVEADGYIPNKTTVEIKKKSEMSMKIKLQKSKDQKPSGTVTFNKDNIIVGQTGNVLMVYVNYIQGMKMTLDDKKVPLNSSVKTNRLEFALPYGAHECKVECPGYYPSFFSVNIGKSKVTKTIKMSKLSKKDKALYELTGKQGLYLGQNAAEVIINVKPIWATAIIDGKTYIPSRKGQYHKILPFGMHDVRIEASGYESKTVKISVEKSKVIETIKLKKL